MSAGVAVCAAGSVVAPDSHQRPSMAGKEQRLRVWPPPPPPPFTSSHQWEQYLQYGIAEEGFATALSANTILMQRVKHMCVICFHLRSEPHAQASLEFLIQTGRVAIQSHLVAAGATRHCAVAVSAAVSGAGASIFSDQHAHQRTVCLATCI